MKRVLVFAALLGWSALASATVYKWVNAKGEVQYGDSPPVGVHATVVHLLGTAEPSAASSNAASSSPTLSNAAFAAQAVAQAKAERARQAVDSDVAAAHRAQCANAKQHYEELINGRHMYTLGPDGKRHYLSSAEIDAARLDAKKQVDTLCGSGESM
ncbi:MAG: DUF4124 domain-containing protein [Gammaproteobacteria bacterium]|nr:DUF4124 domain-containing protein [Gammaproteobacteria bacterium]